MQIENVAIIGAGAVGSALGSVLFDRHGENFSFVAAGERAQRIRKNGLLVNGKRIYPKVTSGRSENKVDLLIICVKNYDLESALCDMHRVADSQTIILPLLNGVTAVERVREEFSKNKVLYGIIMRTDANRTDENITFSTLGEIQYGVGKNEQDEESIKAVGDFFERSGINSRNYKDMEYMLWRKWLVNIASNQVSVLTEAKFKYFGKIDEIIFLMRDAMQEIVEISKKKNIGLTEKDMEEIEQILIHYPPEKRTSMLQDLEAKRRTEIDYFAGTVIKMGEELGIPTPVNRTLYYAIKAREKVYLAEKELEPEG